MEFGWPALISSRFHWPIHGPQALARTVAPKDSRTRHLAVPRDRGPDLFRAGRDHERHGGLLHAVGARLLDDVDHTGDVLVGGVRARADQGHRDVVGVVLVPHRLGHRRDGSGQVRRVRTHDVRLERRQVDLDHAREVLLRLLQHRRRPRRAGRGCPGPGRQARRGGAAQVALDRSRRSGKIDVVAPTSAPMLAIVALPVQEMESTPGPKYSITAFVPPLTVRMPASLRMTSLGAVQPFSVGR